MRLKNAQNLHANEHAEADESPPPPLGNSLYSDDMDDRRIF